MISDHPIAETAERFGRLTSQFEPGTSFYMDVVQGMRERVRTANTRDDLEQVITDLRTKLEGHFTDDQMDQLTHVLHDMRGVGSGWPVEAFKEGFLRGSGEDLPDDGTAAGRSINPDRERA